MAQMWAQLLLLLTQLLPAVLGARILAVYTVPSWSHWNQFRPLLWELAERGHHLTILTPSAEPQPHSNWTVLQLRADFHAMPAGKMDFSTFGTDKASNLRRLFGYGLRICERFMRDPAVQRLIASRTEHFDLFLRELFFNDCFLALAHRFRAPIVGTCPYRGLPWMDDMVGNPWSLAHSPIPLLDAGGVDSLLDRTLNAAYGLLATLYRRHVYLPAIDEIVQLHVPGAPRVADLERNTSMLLLNGYAGLHEPRPMLPNVVSLGGMSIGPAKALPQDLQAFLDDAPDGAIFFSLGSVIKSADMSQEVLQAFTRTFAKLRQKVLWKFDEDTVPGRTANVIISKWLPQQDILGHRNVRAFLTHGGLNSLQEALACAVPVVGFPVFGDQFSNMDRAQRLGFGVRVLFSNVSEESVSWAVREVLDNSGYRAAAARHSSIFLDRPRPPLEEAVFWLEYVLRHRGAPHLRSAALELRWFQLLLLDVAAALVLPAAGVLAVALRCAWRRACGRRTGRSGQQAGVVRKKE